MFVHVSPFRMNSKILSRLRSLGRGSETRDEFGTRASLTARARARPPVFLELNCSLSTTLGPWLALTTFRNTPLARNLERFPRIACCCSHILIAAAALTDDGSRVASWAVGRLGGYGCWRFVPTSRSPPPPPSTPTRTSVCPCPGTYK